MKLTKLSNQFVPVRKTLSSMYCFSLILSFNSWSNGKTSTTERLCLKETGTILLSSAILWPYIPWHCGQLSDVMGSKIACAGNCKHKMAETSWQRHYSNYIFDCLLKLTEKSNWSCPLKRYLSRGLVTDWYTVLFYQRRRVVAESRKRLGKERRVQQSYWYVHKDHT